MYLKTFLRILLITFCGAVIATPCSLRGQATVGIQPFGTYTKDLDQINVGTLGVHVEIPLFSRKERGSGTDISIRLIYDGNSFGIGDSAFLDDQGTLASAWRLMASPNISGGVHVNSTSSSVSCSGVSLPQQNTNFTYTFFDQTGYPHLLSGGSTINGCTGATTSFNLPGAATDGSGYVLTQASAFSYTVVTPSGVSISNVTGNDAVTDTDGNTTKLSWIPTGFNNQTQQWDHTFVFSDTANSYLNMSGDTVKAPTGFLQDPLSIQYRDVNGKTQTITVTYKLYPFYPPVSGPADPIDKNVIDSVTYPDGSAYHFTYEASLFHPGTYTGRLESIQLPTGGEISYVYTDVPKPCGVSFGYYTSQLSRKTSDGTTTYTRNVTSTGEGCSIIGSSTTVSTATNTIVDTFVAAAASPSAAPTIGTYLTSSNYYDGSSPAGIPLKSVVRCYNGETGNCTTQPFVLPITQISESTSYNGNPSSKRITAFNSMSLPIELDEYDYGASAPTRKTVTAYAALGNNIADRPSSVIVYDSSGNMVNSTTYGYDEFALSPTMSNLPGHNAVAGSRGNRTSTHQWLNTSNNTLDSFLKYDDAGQVVQSSDQKSNWTIYGYDSATDSCLTNTTYPQPSSNVTLATSSGCDANSGLVTSSTDYNGAVTQYFYDLMLRSTGNTVTSKGSVVGKTTVAYSGAALPEVITKTVTAAPSPDQVSKTILDGYGRTSSQVLSDGSTIDTTYDSLGRVHTVSNPHVSVGLPTDGITTYDYDALGRQKSQTNPDGSIKTWSYWGAAVQDIDEGNDRTHVSHVSQMDSLGRLISVCEVSSGTMIGGGTPSNCGQQIAATGYLTTYAYDALGNLTRVNQGSRVRTFTYDSLSRLVCASNPENSHVPCPATANGGYVPGAVSYIYDANGNVTSKMSGRGFVTSYQYDALNRKLFQTSSTPNLTYAWHYDLPSVAGVTTINPIGHLTFIGSFFNGTPIDNLSGTMYWNYDAMGRILGAKICTPLTCSSTDASQSQYYDLSYTYDLAGNMTSYTDGFGTTISENYDNAGRLSSVTSSRNDSTHPGTLWSANQPNSYGPAGLLTASIGNFEAESYIYDNRQRLIQITENFHSLGITYNPNSTVKSTIDNLTNNWAYSYDEFNRLSTAVSSNIGFGCGFAYDQYGNRWQQSPFQGSCVQSNVSFSGATNQIDGYCYDADGNLLDMGTCVGDVHQAVYDGYGNLATANHTFSDFTSYATDALGHRIAKWQGTLQRMYLYGLDGNPVAEMDGSGNWLQTNVHAGGKFIAEYQGNDTFFNHTDHLGSIRAQSNSSNTRTLTCFNLPFGDQMNCSGNTDPAGYHFTGKEHDPESSLDNFGARYYNSSIGRFMTPDFSESDSDPEPVPYGDISNPQSLNLYAYVNNNPLTNTDPDGHSCFGSDATSSTDPNGDLVVNGNCNWGGLQNLTFPQLSQLIEGAKNTAVQRLQEITNVLNTPRDPGCMAGAAASGAAAGALGGGIGGGIAGGSIGTLVAPVVGTMGVGFAGAGEGAMIGGQAGFAAGTAVGFIACAQGGSGGSGSGGSGGGAKKATPKTNPEKFRPVRGTSAKVNTETGEVYVRDPSQHGGEHYEVYRNMRDFENGVRDHQVWADGSVGRSYR
jgi:RHS repeat-associated protein